MRRVSELRGLRYPDDFIVRMFFKEALDRRAGRVLELGCGAGNNLGLFQEFGWSVTGVDISKQSLDDARYNLGSDGVELIEADLADPLPSIDGRFDCIILPSVNYYIPRLSFTRLLDGLWPKLLDGGLFYLRSRLLTDWRFGRGEEVERNGYRLNCTETGEYGLLNVFYSVDELITLLQAKPSPLSRIDCFRVMFENPQRGVTVANSDVVIWGRSAAEPGS
jgi:SAM-dependent methyltransferase